MGANDIHDQADEEYQDYLRKAEREDRKQDQRDYQRYLKQRAREEKREGRIQDKRELSRRVRHDRDKERQEKRDIREREKIAKKNRDAIEKEIKRKQKNPTRNERIERYNSMSPWQKFKRRKDANFREDRLAEMKLKAEEQTVKSKLLSEKIKQKKLKQSGQLGSMFGVGSAKKGRGIGARSGRRKDFGDNIPSRGSIFDNSQVGSGLGEMFGNTRTSYTISGKKKKSDAGIDGLRSLFG